MVAKKQKINLCIVLAFLLMFIALLSLNWKTKAVSLREWTLGFSQRPKPFFMALRMIAIKKLLQQVKNIPSRASQDTSPRLSRFLYLVQTDSCLPEWMKSGDIIGNANTCQCDVLVLSYKHACSEKPPEHVTYLFDSSASWNVGRNLLFEAARKRDKKYLYYTFMDDDITLKVEGKPENPWRLFENFLRQTEPAVGVVRINNLWICNLKSMHDSRKKFRCGINKDVDNLPTPFFDPAVNAFHHQAVEHILPYTTRFDSVSWWWSGWYAAIKSEVMFPGQVVVHTKLLGINDQHRPYPRKDPTDWQAIVNEAEADLPERYRNATLLDEWRKDGPLGHFYKSSSLCLPPIQPHMLIKPFAYLQE